MSSSFTESVVEDAALGWLEALGYVVLHLPAPPACALHADRQSDLSAMPGTAQAGATRQAGGPDISPVGDTLTLALSQSEREKYSEVVLEGRLRQALVRLNPDLPPEALEDAYRLPAEDSAQAGKLTRTDAPTLMERNRAMHRMPVCVRRACAAARQAGTRTGRLVDGVTVEYRRKEGSIAAVVPCGETSTDIQNCLQNAMHPYLETAA